MKYQVKDPQGQMHIIDGPEGASPEEVIAQAQKLVPAQQQQSGFRNTINRAMKNVATLGAPSPGMLQDPIGKALTYPFQKGLEGAQGLLDKAGGEVAEQAGRKQMNPYLGATLGMLVANAPMFINPGAEEASSGVALAPLIPKGRMPAVRAAEEFNIPLSRPEKTGSMLSAGLQSFLEKTPLGSRPIQSFNEGQSAALEKAKTGLQGKLGTSADLYSVGQKGQAGLSRRALAMHDAKAPMFDKIPDQVFIPTKELQNVSDSIIQEQSKYLPQTRNSDVISLAQAIQDADKGLASGNLGESFEAHGITKGVAPKTEQGIQYTAKPAGPGTQEPNFPLLKRLREVLNSRIEANNKGIASGMPGQANAVARDYMRLKVALDKDIENYVTSQKTPLGSLMGKEFASTYRKANAFSGAYTNLFKSDDARALAGASPEKIVSMVFQKNNETGIKRFRALVGEDGFQPAKQKFTQDLLESKNVTNEINKYKPGTLAAIYTLPELTQIKKFGLAQGISKGAEKMAGNPSGTARSVIAEGQYGGAGALALSGHPLWAAAVLGAPYGAAKGLVSDAVTKGIPYSIGSGVKNFAGRASIGALLKKLRENPNP